MLTDEQLTDMALRVAKRHLQNHKAALKHLREELRAAGYKQVSSEEFEQIEERVSGCLHAQVKAINVILDVVIPYSQQIEGGSDNSN